MPPAGCDDPRVRTQAQLAAAVEAADRGAWEAARDALEEAWRKRPSARIGAIVAAIETRLPKEELPGRTVGERETTWQTLAAERRPAALSLLLHAAWPVHANVTRQRVALLAQWPPSPRIAHALLALASRDEYASVARAKLLRLIIRTVVAWRDPAVNAYLDLVSKHSFLEAVASSLTEMFSRDLISLRVDRLKQHYPWLSGGLTYFKARLTQAPEDAQFALAWVTEHAHTAAEQNLAVAALRAKCDILWAQLDAIYFAYVEPGWPPPGAFVPSQESRQ